MPDLSLPTSLGLPILLAHKEESVTILDFSGTLMLPYYSTPEKLWPKRFVLFWQSTFQV